MRPIICDCYDHPEYGRVECQACSLIKFAKTGEPKTIEASLDSTVHGAALESVRKALDMAATIAEHEVETASVMERRIGLRIAQRIREEAGKLG